MERWMGPLALVCFLGFASPGVSAAKGNGPKSFIKKGDRQYNDGDYAGCAQSYGEAARRLIEPRATLVYNLACCQALAGQSEAALVSLKDAIGYGFWDNEHLQNDSDLATLRDTPEFKALPGHIQAAKETFSKTNNLEMELLFQEAQRGGALEEGEILRRAEEAYTLFHSGKAQHREDLLKAGFILAQSPKSSHLLTAYKAGERALELGHDNRYARWLMATSWDSYLWSVGEPQIYGSQVRQREDGTYTLEPIDALAVSDSQRRVVGIPGLKESQARVDTLNEGSQ